VEKRRSRRGWGWACALETAGLGQVGKVGRRESNGRVWAGAAGMKRDSGSTVYSGLQRFIFQMHIQFIVYYGSDFLGQSKPKQVKTERRQAMDFCSGKFSDWGNIQKCIFLVCVCMLVQTM
jgi:hypothetical protein